MHNQLIRLRSFLVCLFVFSFSYSQSQRITRFFEAPRPKFSFKIEHVTDGKFSLPGISDFTQSADGLLWMAGTGELIRYDGYDLVFYRTPLTEPDAKFANWHMRVCVDRSGIVWAGTQGGGLKAFDPKTERFVRYLPDPSNPQKLSHPIVTALLEDRNGILWVGTPHGVNSLDRERKQFAQFADDTSETASACSHRVSSILEDRNGTLWIGTQAGLSRFDRALNRFIRYGSTKGPLLRLPSDTLLALCEDRNGTIWIGIPRGLVRFDPRSMKSFLHTPNPKNPRSLSDRPITSLATDRLNNIWIGTFGGGLELYEPSTGEFLHFRSNPRDPTTIQKDYIGRIWAEGVSSSDTTTAPHSRQRVAVVWVIYSETGIGRIVARKNEFHNIRSTELGSADVGGLIWVLTLSHDGTIWAGNWQEPGGGLLNIDLRNNQTVRYLHDEHDARSLTSNSLNQALEDHNRNLWVIAGSKLQRFEPKGRQFRRIALPAEVRRISEGRDGLFWLAFMGNGGFCFIGKMDPTTETCVSYARPRESIGAPIDSHPLFIYEDTYGLVWMGTFSGGLYSFDTRVHTYQRYVSSNSDSATLRINAVSSIVEDPTGDLWIGTHAGLHRFDRKTKAFQYIPHLTYAPTALTQYFIRGMASDDLGNIWIASGPALSRFNIRDRRFRDFGRDEGLGITRLSVIQYNREERTLYLGGIDGLAIFHPDSLGENPHIPTVVLTSFKIHEKNVSLPAPLISTEEIEIPYRDNFISFTFAAVDFVNPSENLYAYMMEGFDGDWIYTGTRRYASYTNLEPGTYVFRAKGANSDGVWNEKGTSIQIVITPPWYRSTSAYVSYAILLACCLFALERYYRRRLTVHHEMQMKDFESRKLREIDQIKSRFFANISHEFRTPLTLILGPIDRIKAALREPELNEDLEVMRRSGRRLLQLINRLLDLSKVDAGQMPLCARLTDLKPFLQELVFSFVSHAERKGIALKFESCEESIEVYVDREKLEDIIVNLLSNAAKFTPRGGEVTVSISATKPIASVSDSHVRTPGFVHIAVRDTGIGIPPEKLGRVFDRFYQVDSASARDQGGKGIGLALVKELVELHQGSITVSSIPNEGSTFTIELPLGRQHLRPDQIIEDDQGAVVEPVALREMEVETLNAETFAPVVQPEVSANKRPTVLVIEDNADVRRYLRSILEEEYQIEEATHGEAGLAIALESLPDLVVSDIMMPGMDGIEVCRSLKTDERTSHIPVILLTARASTESKLEGLETGADDYVTKPFEAEELRARISNLIKIRLKLREKYRQAFMMGAIDQHVSFIDEQFLRKVVSAIEKHLSEPGYETATLAYEVCMSRMNLNRKLQALTGHSTHDFIRTLRLYRAAQLLSQHSGNVSEVAYDVGFSSVSHFAKAFHEQFGETPSDFVEHSSKPAAS